MNSVQPGSHATDRLRSIHGGDLTAAAAVGAHRRARPPRGLRRRRGLPLLRPGPVHHRRRPPRRRRRLPSPAVDPTSVREKPSANATERRAQTSGSQPKTGWARSMTWSARAAAEAEVESRTQVVGGAVVEVDVVDGLVAGVLEGGPLGVVRAGPARATCRPARPPGRPGRPRRSRPTPGRPAGRLGWPASPPGGTRSRSSPPGPGPRGGRRAPGRSPGGAGRARRTRPGVIPDSAASCRNTSPPGTRSRWSAPATSRETVVVPEPGRPEMVISKPGSGEGREQRLALLVAEAADAARCRRCRSRPSCDAPSPCRRRAAPR